jgi:hypothetical protein
LRFADGSAQILAGVSNIHRLRGRWHHEHGQAAAHGGNFSYARGDAQASQLNHRFPQVLHSRFRHCASYILIMTFSGHEIVIATRVPEKIFVFAK